MVDRFDALSVREYTDNNGELKTAWSRIGVAFPAKDRQRLHDIVGRHARADGGPVQNHAAPAAPEGGAT